MEKCLIIPSIFHKISFHPFFYVVAFLSAITGYFEDFFLFMLFIFVHEMGHISAALFYHWHIASITVFPLGAVTFFEEKINRPMKEEFIIAISGVFVQSVFFFFLSFLGNTACFERVHYFVLIFNLLPIYPLDGAKIVNLFLNYFFSFLNSYILTIGISYGLLLSLIVLLKNNLVLLLALFLLLYQVFVEMKKGDFLFYKFLLERYLYNWSFPKLKVIKGRSLKKMKRDHYHFFQKKNKVILEKEILKDLFDNKR